MSAETSQTNHGAPMLVPDHSLDVVVYRLTQLEGTVKDVGNKIDNYAALFVSHQTLELILAPLRADIIELTGKDREREKERNTFRSQLSLAILVCIASPVASIVISVMLGK